MNSMFTLHRTASHHAGQPARRAPDPHAWEPSKAIALERWENEGGRILPFTLSSNHAGPDNRALHPARA